MVSSEPLITIKEADCGYLGTQGKLAVLKNVNLAFNRSELVGVVGLNGAGKSTLLKSISGLLPLLAGEITVNGTSLSQLTKENLSRLISIVLTEKVGGFNLTVFDLVAAGQMPYTDAFHRLKDNHLEIVHQAIEKCGLKSLSGKPINELSDGQFQKAIIAKALAQTTPVMILDEPTAFLDFASKHALFALLKELCTLQQKLILVSSHDLEMLLRYCDKFLIISENAMEIVAGEQARNNPAFQAVAGGFL